MKNEKTHYRKVFKSDHLGVADLEDLLEAKHNLVFTIKEVKQHIGVQVAGRKINANIAYFVEPIKPLVLNATNSKTVKNLVGGSPFVEDWSNIPVRLYIDASAKLKGEIVGGVRVHPDNPRLEKQKLKQGTKAWNNAVAAVKRDSNFEAITSRMIVTDADKKLLKEQANVV